MCLNCTLKGRLHEGVEDILERGKRRSKQLVRSPKKKKPNKSPEKVTKTEKVKENAEEKSSNQKTIQDKLDSTIEAVVKPPEVSEKENVEIPVSEMDATENVADVSEIQTPAEETTEWDCNTSIESTDFKLVLSPEHSAESGSGKLLILFVLHTGC